MEHGNTLKGLLKDLIAIRSVGSDAISEGGTGGEALVCHRLGDYFHAGGIDFETVDVRPGRPNLYASIDRGRPETILLSAHTDTVPAEDWDTDPFDPVEQDGIIHGRGSCDTKASVAAFAAAAVRAAELPETAFNVIFAAVCDEEIGFAGSRAAAADLKAAFAIAGEPTGLSVIHRHKGVMRFILEAQGRSCHSSVPHKGVNAIYMMARAIQGLEALAGRWRSVSDPDLGYRALTVTMVSGGQAPNIVPERCRADIDIRSLPGDSEDALLSELREAAGAEVGLSTPYMSGPPLDTDAAHPLLQRLAETARRGVGVAGYATDAAEYAARGIPAVVFGPGDVSLAHTSREHVVFREVELAAEALVRFLTAG